MGDTPWSIAAERNRQPILDVLLKQIPAGATVLEIGSGTGQHAVFFCQRMPGIRWQPSDREENLSALRALFQHEGNDRILPILKLDVLSDPWPGRSYGAAFSANTAHIMPWEGVVAMFAGIAARLVSGARFCLYGPFNVDNQFTSPSNAAFDTQLRSQAPHMGIRDMGAVEELANLHEMSLVDRIAMPANNYTLVFEKI